MAVDPSRVEESFPDYSELIHMGDYKVTERDRLAEIKAKPVINRVGVDVEWLIAEVERLRRMYTELDDACYHGTDGDKINIGLERAAVIAENMSEREVGGRDENDETQFGSATGDEIAVAIRAEAAKEPTP